MYPVEVKYQPLDAASEERGEINYVDAAVQAAENILFETPSGDLLIFMPGERDIRETADQLEGAVFRRSGNRPSVWPAQFGRSATRLRAIFTPQGRDRDQHCRNVPDHSRHPLRD